VVEIIVEQQIAALVGAHVDYTKKGKKGRKKGTEAVKSKSFTFSRGAFVRSARGMDASMLREAKKGAGSFFGQ